LKSNVCNVTFPHGASDLQTNADFQRAGGSLSGIFCVGHSMTTRSMNATHTKFRTGSEIDKVDRYGRSIGKVMIDGRDANLAMVSAGLAWHYKEYQAEQSASDRRLYSRAEDDARAGRLGLWRDAEPIAPWEWRRGER